MSNSEVRKNLSRYSVFQAWKEDWRANKGDVKARFVLTFFRIVNFFGLRKTTNPIIWIIGLPIIILYRIIVDLIMCIEIPPSTHIGGGLVLHHGQGLVIHHNAIIGKNCLLRHCTTIGCIMKSNGDETLPPSIGDSVEIGSNSVIIGDIKIGDYAKIGAGALVIKDVADGCVALGVPSKVVPQRI